MPRTVNSQLHTVRREAFLDAAQRLIQTQGYEAMSVQDLLDELDTSRGAFYHYFDSKQALLEQVVERMVDGALAAVAPILSDPCLPAPRKLERIFDGIATWKEQRRDLVLAIIRVWASDANAIVREKVRQMTLRRLAPLLSTVVAQGVEERAFTGGQAEQTATVLVSLMLGFQERATELFLARQAGSVTYAYVRSNVDAFARAYERVLGAPEGSLTLTDERTLHFWFG